MTEIHHFTVGQFKCTVINDGYITIAPTSRFFEGASPDELSEALSEYGLAEDGMTIPCSILFVDTGEHKILVDCGSDGEMKGYQGHSGHFFEGLTESGISTSEITHVILSHGHFDHVAGCADDDANPRFANATYIMDKEEYAYWLEEYKNMPSDALMYRKLAGIKDQLQLTDPDAEIFPGVRLIATPGHTYHHISVEFESDGEVLLCPVDVMDHPLQGQHSTWGADWDVERPAGIESRRKILQRASDKNALVQGFHFPFPGLGRFRFDGTVWLWDDEA